MANKENIAVILLQKQVSHSHNCSLPNSLKNYPFLDANSSNLFPLTQKDDYQNKDPSQRNDNGIFIWDMDSNKEKKWKCIKGKKLDLHHLQCTE